MPQKLKIFKVIIATAVSLQFGVFLPLAPVFAQAAENAPVINSPEPVGQADSIVNVEEPKAFVGETTSTSAEMTVSLPEVSSNITPIIEESVISLPNDNATPSPFGAETSTSAVVNKEDDAVAVEQEKKNIYFFFTPYLFFPLYFHP